MAWQVAAEVLSTLCPGLFSLPKSDKFCVAEIVEKCRRAG